MAGFAAGGDPTTGANTGGVAVQNNALDTVWDVGNILYDAAKVTKGQLTGDQALVQEGLSDLALDTAAAAIPGVPAGMQKIGRTGAKVAEKVGETLSTGTAKEVGENVATKVDDAKLLPKTEETKLLPKPAEQKFLPKYDPPKRITGPPDAKVPPPERQAYLDDVGQMHKIYEEAKARGDSKENIGKMLQKMRREIGEKHKDLTPKEFREEIYKRNIDKYGDPLGPTVDWLRKKGGKTWDEIIESALRPGGQDIDFWKYYGGNKK